MRRAVAARFRNHPGIRDVPLSTGDEEIVEDTATDHRWGQGTAETGRNILGRTSTRTRGRLRAGLPRHTG